jgi:PKD repeat protein
LAVEFTMCDINDNSAQDKRAAIDFGDGQGSAEACKVTHTYSSPGTYQATLRFRHQTAVMVVRVVQPLRPVIELLTSPARSIGIEPTPVVFRLTDLNGEAMTWSSLISVPPPYSGGTLTPASGGPVPSGSTVTTEYQTPGGLAVAVLTLITTNTSGLSSARSIVIPTCQPTGGVTYPSTGSLYPTIAAGDSFTFTLNIGDCREVAVTLSATVENGRGGTFVMVPADGTVVHQGTVQVTFQSAAPTTASITITGTDSLGATTTLLRDQTLIVQ